MRPFVSILVPAFNAQEWIADSLRSAIAQTWDRREIIVVDDGSTDQTLAVARQFEANGVRVVTQANQGAAAARNKALSLSHGDYIQWLDADDLLASDKIAKQIEAMHRCQSKRTLLSGAWGQFFYRCNRAQFAPTALWCSLSPTEWILRKLEHNLFMQTATWLVSRELTQTAGPWDTRLLSDDDGEYFCRVVLSSDGVRFVPDAKVFYRISGPLSLGYIGRSDRKVEAQWLSMKLQISHLRSLANSPRVRKACTTYLQNWMMFFYSRRPDLFKEAETMLIEFGGKSCVLQSKYYPWIWAGFHWCVSKRGLLALSGGTATSLAFRSRRPLQGFFDKVLHRIETHRTGS